MENRLYGAVDVFVKREYQRGEQAKAARRYHSALLRARNATVIDLIPEA
jgi:hypothetical protein